MKGKILMPIVCVLLLFAPLVATTGVAISENAKEQKVNQMCVEKFKTPSEIQQCKTILMKVNPKDITNDR